MTTSAVRLLLGFTMALAGLPSLAQTAPAASRGQLLYNTFCVACHDRQVHWRQNSKLSDWAGLQMQVRQWQASEKLQWTEDDINQVARYLNDTIYRFPATPLALGR